MSKSSNKLLKTLLFIGGAAGAIYCFNQHINTTSSSKNKLKVKKDSYYEWKYGNIYYQKAGEGNPVLLIHDFSHCGSSCEWNKLVDSLAESHTVYTLDLLGCGRSDKPQITYTNFLFVQLVTDFMEDVIGEKTTIISSGFSSSIAIMSAAYNQSLINKLVFINPADIHSLTQETSTYSRIYKDILELPLIGTFIYNLLTTKTRIDKQLTESFFYNPFQINADLIDTYYEAAHRGKGNGKYILSNYYSGYMNANIAHGIKKIEKDILIIGGEQEGNIKEIIEEHKELNDNITSVVISKTKRIPHFEKPEEVLEAIKTFL